MTDTAPRLTAHTLSVGGRSRRFILAEPEGRASAVVLALHGTRSSASRHAGLCGMASLAGTAAAAVAFPEAVVPRGFGFEWDHDLDEPFLLQLIAYLVERHPTPGGRVCITGMSGGARMSSHFAWRHAEKVSVLGAVAGLRAGDGPPPSRPVPVLAFHGTADRINPYAGSGTARWGEGVLEAAGRWALANRVPPEPSEVAVTPRLTRATWGESGKPGEVTLWIARGAGHTWPGRPVFGIFLRLLLGRTTKEVDATDQIWRFAQEHPADP